MSKNCVNRSNYAQLCCGIYYQNELNRSQNYLKTIFFCPRANANQAKKKKYFNIISIFRLFCGQNLEFL